MKIVEKRTLAQADNTKITLLKINSANIALKAKAGQFVVVMAAEEGERVPLTVVDKDINRGTITLVFQETGLTTRLLGKFEVNSFLYALAGPLGHPTKIKNYGRVILIGGGVGAAEIYPAAKALKGAGNYIVTILGARTKNLLILEKELKNISDELHIITDDGSCGKKGFTTDILKNILAGSRKPKACGLVYAVGPIPMMRSVALITKDAAINTIVSLNALMVDATGMCGCCRVNIAGKTMFTCIDGPEFDGHLVDWDEFAKRSRLYEDKERHICKLNKL